MDPCHPAVLSERRFSASRQTELGFPLKMDFGERKRSRKSQSFKLVTDEGLEPSLSYKDSSRGPKDAAATVPDDWMVDEGMEIKKQITGMMRLLSDKTGRVYQRVGPEQSQDRRVTLGQQPAPLHLPPDDNQNNWTPTEAVSSPTASPVTNGLSCSQYSTRSRALRSLSSTKDTTKASEVNANIAPPSAAETPCCTCNCKDTLQAILQELRVMRKLMQTQKASLEKQEQAVSPGQPHLSGPAPRHRPFKRRPVYRVPPLTVSSVRRAVTSAEASPTIAAPAESGNGHECDKEPEVAGVHSFSSEAAVVALPPQDNPETSNNAHTSLLNQPRKPPASESEVRLAEDHDVFISKAQLDSILINYTRSGSLLFRKLVCAFFDDATLANSLPNGKRKRGLNDNRKGLDQNIVGAIKVFTEKYCTEHKIDKLPGPRDWVQILQDQIKLARRRLKRDAAEEVLNGQDTSNI